MSLLINFLIILTTISCQQNKNNTLTRDDFSISYPSHLKLDESGQDGTIFILKTEKQEEDDIFIENINLATKKIGSLQFNEFATKTENEIGSIAKITENKRLKVNGKDYLRLVFELSQNNVDLTFVQHYFIKNEKIYVLTFSSESNVFNEYVDEMDGVLASFKIK